MAGTIGNEQDPVDMLVDLMALDWEAMRAAREASERMLDPESKSRFDCYVEDHRRHVNALESLARPAGLLPEWGDNLSGRVTVAEPRGDVGILDAMQTNSERVIAAYERACDHELMTDDIRHVLRDNLANERQHLAWLADRRQRMSDAH